MVTPIFRRRIGRERRNITKQGIQKEPDNADLYNNLAWLYYTRKENLDQAEKLAQKAIGLNPAKEKIYRDTLEKIREIKEEAIK